MKTDVKINVHIISAVIRLCYINMFQHSYFTIVNFLGLR